MRFSPDNERRLTRVLVFSGGVTEP